MTTPRHSIVFLLSLLILLASSVTLAGNVIVRNGQLNVSAGIYSDSDTLYIDSENDMVGIGTTGPEQKLHVNSSDNVKIAIETSDSSKFSQISFVKPGMYWAIGTQTTTDDFVLYAGEGAGSVLSVNHTSGRIGIGTTSPHNLFHIRGDDPDISLDITPESPNNLLELRFLFNGTIKSKIYWSKSDNKTYIDNNGSIIVLDPSGKVGIGTASPTSGLHLRGSDNGRELRIEATDDDPTIVLNSTIKEWLLQQVGSGSPEARFRIFDQAGAGEVFTIQNETGNIGIGISSPEAKLHIRGTAGYRLLMDRNYSGAIKGWRAQITHLSSGDEGTIMWDALNSTSDWRMRDESLNTLIQVNTSSGRVGIGTTSPGAAGGGEMLEIVRDDAISNSIRPVIGLTKSTTGTAGDGLGAALGFNIEDDAGDIQEAAQIAAILSDVTAGSIDSNLVFRVRKNSSLYSEKMRIDEDGDVGIGTASPEGRLEIYATGLGSNVKMIKLLQGGGGSKITSIASDTSRGFQLVDNYWSNRVDFQVRTSGDDINSNWTDAMTIEYDGDVGIGTTTPDANLEIIGSSYSGSKGSGILKIGASGTGHYIEFGTNGSTIPAWIQSTHSTGPSSSSLLLNPFGGGVGIGNTIPNDALDVVGDIDATGCVQTDDSGSIGGTCVSDIRLKTNIQPLTGSLERITQLNPVTFQWDSTYYNISSETGSGVGLIAQELEEIYPQLVVTDANGYKRVRYDIELEMHLIQAVKELKEENDRKDGVITEMKDLLCMDHPEAEFCTPAEGGDES